MVERDTDDTIDFVGDELAEVVRVVSRDVVTLPLSLALDELDVDPYGDVVAEVDKDSVIKIDAEKSALDESAEVAEKDDKEDGDDDGRSLSDTTGELVPVTDEIMDADMDAETVSENLSENEVILVLDAIQVVADGEADIDELPDIEGDAMIV
jgi:phosphoenolpyruvate carboxylase